MAAAGIGGGRDEAMAEKCFLFAADEANAASAVVLYRLAQLHLTALEAEEPVDVSAPLSWLSRPPFAPPDHDTQALQAGK